MVNRPPDVPLPRNQDFKKAVLRENWWLINNPLLKAAFLGGSIQGVYENSLYFQLWRFPHNKIGAWFWTKENWARSKKNTSWSIPYPSQLYPIESMGMVRICSYIYLEPSHDLYFWRSFHPQNKAFSNQNKGRSGSRYLHEYFISTESIRR